MFLWTWDWTSLSTSLSFCSLPVVFIILKPFTLFPFVLFPHVPCLGNLPPLPPSVRGWCSGVWVVTNRNQQKSCRHSCHLLQIIMSRMGTKLFRENNAVYTSYHSRNFGQNIGDCRGDKTFDRNCTRQGRHFSCSHNYIPWFSLVHDLSSSQEYFVLIPQHSLIPSQWKP